MGIAHVMRQRSFQISGGERRRAELAGQGSAVVVTGHDVTDLLAVADDVTWMVAGTTHQLGTPAEARRHDQFVREYLGSR